MKIIFCGGGTAGHITPAIAVAEEVRKSDKNAKILFIGRNGGRENELVKKAGFEIKTINVGGLKRSLSLKNIKTVLNAVKAIKTASSIIEEFDPDVILGTGGYVCWPVIYAGKRLGVRTAIHESNVIPGLTTRLIAGKCNKVFLNHKETADHLGSKVKTVVVGNPLRSEFYKITKDEARRKLGIPSDEILIVSFGGSIGAEKINNVMLEVIEKYSSQKSKIKHLHSTGERYFWSMNIDQKKYESKGCKILPFINDMPTALRAADIAVCRSGAMTLSELAASEVAAILIPSPNVTDNHQYKNAKHLLEAGAAVLIEEKNLSAEVLITELDSLKNDKNGRKKRAKTLSALQTPDSARLILGELFPKKQY
ncbi:MAG: undecaprenyldiphospho-muramoylpentapeptide beta-N-acetylglucosaminyltransferase [Clostridia bacterium]|nr:undecaprenyldiphospho-muramoylpentapeptide beta-N-acetylglucosaminyltransferase [Clostridia bacterium]